jgi:predicted RNA binding protein YcfA (HicA-like mRNA interferase family)
MTERLPTIKAGQMARVLEKLGFSLKRQKGSHAFFYHPDGRRAAVPIHPGDLPRSVFCEILKHINVSDDEVRRLL